MNFYISVITHCPCISIDRKVICYPLISGGFGCEGCEDANESEICKKCISNVVKKTIS